MWLYSSQTCTSHFLTRPVVTSAHSVINGSRVKLRQGLSNVPALLAPVIISQVSITDDKIMMDIIDTYRSVDSRLPLMWIALEGDLVSVMAGVRNTGVREKKRLLCI